MSVRATAFAPASVGNVAVGFDMLGLALDAVGDRVTAERSDGDGVEIAALTTTELAHTAAGLPRASEENTASIAAASLWRAAGAPGGVRLSLEKGVPPGSGMGSSAASAVAAVVAVNALLDEPWPPAALLRHALAGEQHVSRARHADNVAPSLLGGLVLCPTRLLPETVPLPVPAGVVCVVVYPQLRLDTAVARSALAGECLLRTAVEQQACLAGFVAGCYRDDRELVAASLRDVLIEPQRAPMVPGFTAVKSAAIDAGAYGCSLSGSGPSVFAWCDEGAGETVRAAMIAAFAGEKIDALGWLSPLDAPGARLESD